MSPYDAKAGHLVVRKKYADLVCPSCKKVDEYTALRRGIDPAVKVKLLTGTDLVRTADELDCVSQKFRKVAEKHGIGGLEFLPIPKQPEQFIIIPSLIAPTDAKIAAKAGMEFVTEYPKFDDPKIQAIYDQFHKPDFYNQCRVCGRYRVTALWPVLEAIQLPSNPLTFFEPSVKLEGESGIMSNLMCSEAVKDILDKEGIEGVDYFEM